MAAGPVHDLSVEHAGPSTCSRYTRERKASVEPPFCGNRTSSTPEPPLASPIELLVVPKSIPIRKAGAGSVILHSPCQPTSPSVVCHALTDDKRRSPVPPLTRPEHKLQRHAISPKSHS